MAAASTGAFGMMDPAYFVGRIELLKWLNSFLSLQYSKIEEVCSGVAFCMIMDALHPGSINLSRVKFDAKSEYEFIHNLKLLQTAFDHLHLDKQLDIPKLVTGKFQNNLDLCQWMKKYFDTNWKEGMSYNAPDARAAAIAAAKGRPTLTSSGNSSSSSTTMRENVGHGGGATPTQQPSPADGIIGVRAGAATRSSRSSIATPSTGGGSSKTAASSSAAPRASIATTSRATTTTTSAAPRASLAVMSNRTNARSKTNTVTATTSAATTTTNSSATRGSAVTRGGASKRIGKAAAAEEQVTQLTQQCQQQSEALKQHEDEIAQLRAEIQCLQETTNGAIKERDFVMTKLQEVEQIYQDNEQDPEQLKLRLREILFVDMSIEPLAEGPAESLLDLGDDAVAMPVTD